MRYDGYKAFFCDCSTRNGMVLQENKIYICESVVKFRHSGFHFCKRLEDTLRYFDGFQKIKFAKVIGSGKIDEYVDEYYGYYDMYSCSRLYIDHFLTNDEINDYIDMLVKLAQYYPERLIRMISGYKLSSEQKKYILENVKSEISNERVKKAIKYYQENKKNVYYLK